ncbi:lymphocyte antigen 6A-2/6E-1-like [Grammomys surdaster]|uniref:lymphocyte antigen 6A-2/6E-1-like n=1 Tax=Grammomys surdaster TaxID=491861 RepID=UPI00109F0F69|nr:lymphocyte antigen 6A-2/6E-1-like [Grammomys surdaster]
MNSSQATKSCVLILLVALLCAQRAQGLKCYNCQGLPIEATCSSSINCSEPNGVCVAQEAEVTVGSKITKVKGNACLPECPIDLEQIPKLGTTLHMKVFCCNEDLCNAKVPIGTRTRTTARPRSASVQPGLRPPANLAVMVLPPIPTLILLSLCLITASLSPLVMNYEL